MVSDAQDFFHRVASGTAPDQPLGSPHRPARENAAVLGTVRQGDALLFSGENDAVFARHRSPAQRGKADRAFPPRASMPVAPALGMVGEGDPASPGCCFAEQEGGPAGGVDLAAMVHFDDLDIPVRPQP